MKVNDQKFTTDLIIFPDRIDSDWWRRSGHHLIIDDLKEALKVKPEVLVIGTGFMGLMKVDEAFKDHIQNENIVLIVEKTKKAVDIFNKISQTKKTIGAFHLTC
jgi:hypothetical protein